MTQDQALDLVGRLVVLTSGWTDETVDGLVEQIMHRWPDPAVGSIAIDEILESWSRSSRPPWGVLNDAYKSAKRRADMLAPVTQISSYRSTLTFDEGIVVAYRAYTKYVKSQGREPRSLEAFTGQLVRARKAR